MGSDMLVALKEASANGNTLFAVNQYAASDTRRRVCRLPAQTVAPGEMIHTASFSVPQVRQTYAVLGVQPVGRSGLLHGVNENHVAIGVTDWKSRMHCGSADDAGPDLVRIALERGRSAHHAVDILTDLLEHLAQTREADAGLATQDHIFLIADACESYVLETTGHYWALLECRHSRVVTDAAMIRQDWRRLAPGLADCVVERGWWKDDGNKLDFVGCLANSAVQSKNAQKRWGRASLALAQQQGAIDAHFLRRMLGDHYSTNRELISSSRTDCLANSFLVELNSADQPVLGWVAFGPPQVALFFPVPIVGEIPDAYLDGGHENVTLEGRTHELLRLHKDKDRVKLTHALERMQTKFDQDAEAFLARAQDLTGQASLIAQYATDMMEHHVEMFHKEHRQLFGVKDRQTAPVREKEELLYFA